MSASKTSLSQTWVISAQDLLTGEVMYMCDGDWSRILSNASLFTSQTETETALSGITDPDVVFPAAVTVRQDAFGTPKPLHMREGMRATGPTNRFIGKQADYGEVHHV